MAKVTLREIDRRIENVRSLLDVTTGRLVELDADVTRQLLESSTSLRGVTAVTWADASARHAALWRAQFALERALTTVVEARGERRFVSQSALHELDDLLRGLQVELPLPDSGAPVRLTQGADPFEAVALDAALQRMSADYDLVSGVVMSVAEVWGPVSETLHGMQDTLSDIDGGARGELVTSPNQLRVTRQEVDDEVRTAQHDPLGLSRSSVTDLETRVARLVSANEDAARGRLTWTHELRQAGQLVETALDALNGCRDELWRVAEKVAAPDGAEVEMGRLTLQLAGLRAAWIRLEQTGGGDAGALYRRVQVVLAQVDALAAAARGQLARRDQLRGLLEAYRAKVTSLGLAEDPELEARFGSAHDLLSVAPCDVEAAQHAVQDYLDAVRRSGRRTTGAGS
jgi:hypothetical protein